MHGETEKEIIVDLFTSTMDDDIDLFFEVVLSDPTPEGCKLSKKDNLVVNIVGDKDQQMEKKEIKELLELIKK